jgi:transcriptional regulator with XRE-family HTH domain
MQTKIAKEITDTGFGFPVRLSNVPLVEVRGEWVPKIDYNKLAERVLLVLSRLTRPLTGHEVRFVRQHFNLTLAQFGAKFGVSHVSVMNWEKKGDKATAMQWPTEKDLRLFIQTQFSKDPAAVGRLYAELAEKPAAESGKHKAIGPVEAKPLVKA